MRVLQKQVVSDFSNSLGVENAYQKELFRGVARMFQRGGHTVSNIIVMAFSPRNIVGCLLKKKPTKGGSRAPQDPPRYALVIVTALSSTCDNKPCCVRLYPDVCLLKEPQLLA